MSDDTPREDSPQAVSRVVEARSDADADRGPLFGQGHPIVGIVAIGAATGGIGGYIIATINYAETTGVALSTLVDPADLGGAAILLGVVAFWLGVLVEKHTGGDGDE